MKKRANKSTILSMTKMQGTGNSFLIMESKISSKKAQALAKKLCDFHFGPGADGLVILHPQKNDSLRWDFFNSDGSAAEFCGNAARCVAEYAFETWAKKKISLQTVAGTVKCEIKKKNLIAVEMPNPKWIKKEIQSPFWNQPVAWINTGVPHLVVELTTDKELQSHTEDAKKMRSWEGLGSAGANVTFVYFSNPKSVSAVTFERGVEGYTLACGTGAVAAAMYAMDKNKTQDCLVKMPGGDLHIKNINEKIYMEGEAWRVANIEVPTKAIS